VVACLLVPSLRVTPTLRALGAATTFLLLATVPPRSSRLLDLLLAALLALVALAFFLAVTALRRLRIEREVPATGARGETVPLLVRVVNASSTAAFALVVEEQHMEHAAAPAFVAAVPGPGDAEARGRLRLAERGRLKLRGTRVAATDPFGLFRAARSFELPGEILVHPRPRRLAARRVLEDARTGRAAGARGARQRESTETAFVREYRHGDSPRSVNWRLSARTGNLIVKTFVEERQQDALIVLDRVPPGSSPAALSAFERAVALAAGLGVEILDQGAEVAFMTTGEGAVRLERLRGRTGRTALLSALALVRPDTNGATEAPPVTSRTRDVFLVTARGARASTLAAAGQSKLRLVVVEGPGPASSGAVIGRYAGRLRGPA